MNKSLSKSEGLLSRKQAAEFLGNICVTTLDRLKIARTVIRRRVFYRLDVLEKWIADNTQAQAQEGSND